MSAPEGFETDEGVDEPEVVHTRTYREFEIREMDHGLHRVYQWREHRWEWVYEESFFNVTEAREYIDAIRPPEDNE